LATACLVCGAGNQLPGRVAGFSGGAAQILDDRL